MFLKFDVKFTFASNILTQNNRNFKKMIAYYNLV